MKNLFNITIYIFHTEARNNLYKDCEIGIRRYIYTKFGNIHAVVLPLPSTGHRSRQKEVSPLMMSIQSSRSSLLTVSPIFTFTHFHSGKFPNGKMTQCTGPLSQDFRMYTVLFRFVYPQF